ncbi:MAG: hypothetical protein E6I03_11420 [Chloroflexi bacterium]|nr:MAG: hypothetical protein E6I03_11420 [Chloroflexota bacterium]
MTEANDATHEQKDALRPHWMDFLPNRKDGLPDDIYWQAVPIWCGESHDALAERLGEEYACGFAYGFERGIIMSLLRPEWAQGFYFELREHYASTHAEEDPTSWGRCADETAAAMPVSSYCKRNETPLR